jgi:hypothetical protein
MNPIKGTLGRLLARDDSLRKFIAGGIAAGLLGTGGAFAQTQPVVSAFKADADSPIVLNWSSEPTGIYGLFQHKPRGLDSSG